MYFEDATICRRIRETGFEIIYEPSETIIHLLGRSYDSNSYKIDFEYRRSQLRYYRMFNSSIENVLLRSYLILNYFFKYMKSLFMNFAERRYIADVIRCVLTEPIS
jgi:GT2 family glycosyltransferase